MPDNAMNIKVISHLGGVTPRTVYFYIQKGLLPHPGTFGPGAKYERRHLIRLRLIKLLQREHLPLAKIRERMEALSDDQAERMLRERSQASPLPDSDGAPGSIAQNPPRTTLTSPKSTAGRIKAPIGVVRSQWDRVVLTRDIELHIRRPLTRERNKQLARLLDVAREILGR